jgi:hypothetical protein
VKFDYADLKKSLDYIEKHGDKGMVDLTLTAYGTVKDALQITFMTMDGDKVTIAISEDERAFDTITRTERF